MPTDISQKLIIAISSRTLFDLQESNTIFEKEGVDQYASYQIEHENDILQPGVAFNLIKKLLSLHHPVTDENLVEVILLSRNSADTGLRIFNSIEHYGLDIVRAAFTEGNSPFPYVQAFGSHLFLSANPDDVRQALETNCAAALMLPSNTNLNSDEKTLRIAFDGDAVIFSDESEKIFQQQGLNAFTKNEKDSAKKLLTHGPFKGFLEALHQLQQKFSPENCPVRTALVTARQAPTHERVIRTLRAWHIRIDEALFLGGLSKGEFLRAFKADIFFDDYEGHCDSARQYVATAQVLSRQS